MLTCRVSRFRVAVTSSQTFLLLMTVAVLRMTGQVFDRMPLSRGLSDVFLMRRGYGCFEGGTQWLTAILVVSPVT